MRSASSSSTLASVKFSALALAIVAHLLKTMCTSRAWRNTIAASYPEEPVRWVQIYASYLAGVGVERDHPGPRRRRRAPLPRPPRCARQHVRDARRRRCSSSPSSTWRWRSLIFVYALTLGVLPAVGSLGKLPGFDFGFFASNPEFSFVLFVALVIFGVIGVLWLRLHVAEFKQRVRQGLTVMRPWTGTSVRSLSGRRATGCSATSRSGSSSTRSGSSSRFGTSCSSR